MTAGHCSGADQRPAAGMVVTGALNSYMRDLYYYIEKLNFSGFDGVEITTMASCLGGEAGVKAMFSGLGCCSVLWYL